MTFDQWKRVIEIPWFKVDDQLYSHPKWLGLTPHARSLWVTAGSWCAAHPKDGAVPVTALAMLGGRARDAVELVGVGLWEEADDGWLFHDWLEFQPSAESVMAERQAARDRMRKARDAKKNKSGGS